MENLMQTANKWNNEGCDPLKDLETIANIMLEEVGYRRNEVYENLTIVQMFSTGEVSGTLGGKKVLTLFFDPNKLKEPIETIARTLQEQWPNISIKAQDNSLVIEGNTFYGMVEVVARIADYIKLELTWESLKTEGLCK